eukprot:15361635-Ditylum_brightwellii.AAC.1
MGQVLFLFKAPKSLVQGGRRHRETFGVDEEDVIALLDMVKGVKRFSRDLDALLRLGSSLIPPEWLELTNLVDALEAEGAQGILKGTE